MLFTAEYRQQKASGEFLRLNMDLHLLTKLSTDMFNLYAEVSDLNNNFVNNFYILSQG